MGSPKKEIIIALYDLLIADTDIHAIYEDRIYQWRSNGDYENESADSFINLIPSAFQRIFEVKKHRNLETAIIIEAVHKAQIDEPKLAILDGVESIMQVVYANQKLNLTSGVATLTGVDPGEATGVNGDYEEDEDNIYKKGPVALTYHYKQTIT
jgi:hypothetical protein